MEKQVDNIHSKKILMILENEINRYYAPEQEGKANYLGLFKLPYIGSCVFAILVGSMAFAYTMPVIQPHLEPVCYLHLSFISS